MCLAARVRMYVGLRMRVCGFTCTCASTCFEDVFALVRLSFRFLDSSVSASSRKGDCKVIFLKRKKWVFPRLAFVRAKLNLSILPDCAN